MVRRHSRQALTLALEFQHLKEYQLRSCVAETATIHNASRRLALHKNVGAPLAFLSG
jgi:hypothetical protein